MKTKTSRERVVVVTTVIILLSGMGAASLIVVVSSSVFEPGSVVALAKSTGTRSELTGDNGISLVLLPHLSCMNPEPSVTE